MDWDVNPDIQQHMVRVEWSGKLEVDRSGDYTFELCSDDGSRLSINDTQRIDNWGLHGRRCRNWTQGFGIGWQDLHVSFFENQGAATCTLRMKGPDTNDQWVEPSVWHLPPKA